MINDFRNTWIPAFPFVVIEPTASSSDIRQQTPFLFLCILGVTISITHPLRKRIHEDIMDQVSSRIFRNSERDLDLLRGLLVHTAWYRYPVQVRKREILFLVQLCVTLTYDLDLERKAALTADEKRAMLGTYWLSNGYVEPLEKGEVADSFKELRE